MQLPQALARLSCQSLTSESALWYQAVTRPGCCTPSTFMHCHLADVSPDGLSTFFVLEVGTIPSYLSLEVTEVVEL